MRKINSCSILLAILLVFVIGSFTFSCDVLSTTDDVELSDTNFPDDNFRFYLQDNYDNDHNNFLSYDEMPEELDVNVIVENYKGIELLYRLKNLTIDYEYALSSLDLCNLPALESLTIEGCDKLTKVKIDNCPSLSELNCVENSKLQDLDINNCPSLKSIKLISNAITELDLSQCSSLTNFTATFNYNLTSLSINNCQKLESIYMAANGLSYLDVSGLKSLKSLYCGATPLNTLKASGCISLEELDCSCTHENYTYPEQGLLKTLDVSNCTNLKKLNCQKNVLNDISFDGCSSLTELNCSSTQITSLDTTSLINLKDLNVADCTMLEHLSCYGSSVSGGNLENIDIDNCTSLQYLECFNNSLSSVDVSTCTNLDLFSCENNLLSSLDVSNCTNLTELRCSNNKLTKLDISKCTSLARLLCEGNNISNLDITSCILDKQIIGFCKSWYNDDDIMGCDNTKYILLYDNTANLISTLNSLTAYPVAIKSIDGNASVSSEFALAGTYIYIYPISNEGYELESISYSYGNGSDIDITSNKCFEMPDASVTVSVVFKPKTYTVNFELNGGSYVPSQTVKHGSTISQPNNPTKTNYTFDGWYIDSSFTKKYDFSNSVTKEGITLYAKWKTIPTSSTNTPTPEPVKTDSFENFVERLYLVALNRSSEPEGKAFWCEHVGNGDLTGAACAREFLTSQEFKNRGLSDEDFLTVLYKTFFDRDANNDPDGFNFWLNSLKSQGRDTVVEGFINSPEWCNICATYGVKSGADRAKATIASKKAIDFAERLYTKCLGRDSEADGLNYWSLALTNLEVSGSSAARQFFESPEFRGHKFNNEEYLTRLYRTFMGREPDRAGLDYWLDCMSSGMSRETVFDSFVASKEFTDICKEYGIDR